MITDPLVDVERGAYGGRLLRGFSHLSSPHLTVPGLSCVGDAPAQHRVCVPLGRPLRAYGLRVGITLSHGAP